MTSLNLAAVHPPSPYAEENTDGISCSCHVTSCDVIMLLAGGAFHDVS